MKELEVQIPLKIIGAAILSLIIGIACTLPLLFSELQVKPFIRVVEGEKAELSVNLIYANITIQNEHLPITNDSGPTVKYFAVLNVTNISEIEAKLEMFSFLAAKKITPDGAVYYNSGNTWEAEGAWVDGKWYNITWTNGTNPWAPKIVNLPTASPHWMEGVQIHDEYSRGKLNKTYLNMNGTWTEVTGRITVDRPAYEYREIDLEVVLNNEVYFVTYYTPEEFKFYLEKNYSKEAASGIQEFYKEVYSGYDYNGVKDSRLTKPYQNRMFLAGNGYFDNTLDPHQSRLFVMAGNWNATEN